MSNVCDTFFFLFLNTLLRAYFIQINLNSIGSCIKIISTQGGFSIFRFEKSGAIFIRMSRGHETSILPRKNTAPEFLPADFSSKRFCL